MVFQPFGSGLLEQQISEQKKWVDMEPELAGAWKGGSDLELGVFKVPS